jgi:hypothetical protein
MYHLIVVLSRSFIFLNGYAHFNHYWKLNHPDEKEEKPLNNGLTSASKKLRFMTVKNNLSHMSHMSHMSLISHLSYMSDLFTTYIMPVSDLVPDELFLSCSLHFNGRPLSVLLLCSPDLLFIFSTEHHSQHSTSF